MVQLKIGTSKPLSSCLLKPKWEKEKMLVTSIFSFSNKIYFFGNVFQFWNHFFPSACNLKLDNVKVTNKWASDNFFQLPLVEKSFGRCKILQIKQAPDSGCYGNAMHAL